MATNVIDESYASPLPLAGMWRSLRALLEDWGFSLVLLWMRLWIAKVFFMSGLTKIRDWENTMMLFQYEYAVPVLPVGTAALLATVFELVMPVLLVIGLFTRFAALPLLAMALVIQFVLGAANPAYNNTEHYYWMMLLLTLICAGAGRISLDWYLRQKFLP
ncbi:MAG: DoxX family protein [Geminicoccaceae bacterium]